MKEPSQRQRCHKCKNGFHLSDGGFIETLDAQGELIFVCESCEPNMAPRDDEWTRGLGHGRTLVMERVSDGYRATLVGFRGDGTTQGAALDNLLARMRDYSTATDDLAQALTPDGHLSKQLRQIEQLVDQITQETSQS